MRYRIQIEDMLNCTLCVVSEIVTFRGSTTVSSKMYTLEETYTRDGLVELLGELQRVIGETMG